MAAPERLQLQPAGGRELPLHLQRELWLLVDAHWNDDGDCDVDGLAAAIAQFAFDNQLVYVPATESLAREGLRFYPVAPHELKPVWLVGPPQPAQPAQRRATRRPTLRELGAERIER